MFGTHFLIMRVVFRKRNPVAVSFHRFCRRVVAVTHPPELVVVNLGPGLVTEDQPRALPVPLQPPHLLTGPLGDEPALVTIGELHHEVRVVVGRQTLHPELLAHLVVIAKHLRNLAQMLHCQPLGVGHDDNKILFSEQADRQSVVVGQRCALGVLPRRCDGGVQRIGAVQPPALAVEVRGRLRVVVHRRQENPRERLHDVRVERDALDGGQWESFL